MKHLELFSKLNLFTKADLTSHFQSPMSLNSALFGYIKRGLVVRIKNGLYAAVNPAIGIPYAGQYEIATGAASDAYVAYHTALEYHGIANQVYNTFYFCSTARVRSFEYGLCSYNRICPPKVTEGIITTEIYAPVRVTCLERTIVDCINRLDLAGGLGEVIMAITACPYLNEDKLEKYLDEYGEKYLYQKAGFILWQTKQSELSKVFFDYCKARVGNRRSYMIENKGEDVMLNTEWNLIIPRSIYGVV
ncbi:MAG: hypothetical protein LBU04_03560 [Christensenellaceae bacterium]|jgi:predicted transcriptional regulator of viral defense system|nr:hypothetical protein [Christensenellaceae bacterium]